MPRLSWLALGLVISFGALAGEAAPPAFVKKPAVTKAGDKTTITFAVDRETDVAVYIEDAKGRVVRHLAAGVLGKNAPEPLKAGVIEQSVEWDGKDDDGKPAEGGPFKVRVGLGLKASWGGLAFADLANSGPNMLEGVVTGLAVGPDGRVYVGQPHHVFIHGSVMKTLVFRRDGAYERTLMPFPPNLPMDRLKATGAFVNSFGAVNPRQGPYAEREIWFYPAKKALFQSPAVMPDGRLVMAVLGDKGVARLAVVDAEGGIPMDSFAGPALGLGWLDSPFLMAASDGKAVYAARLGAVQAKASHAVYRVKMPDRGPAEPFFGEPDKAGNDETHLNDPRAVALDGKGHMLIADSGNNRIVVVKESDRSFAGSFAVEAPTWVGVHQKTGAVYVLSKGTRVIKFGGWKDTKELAGLDLQPVREPLFSRTEPTVALDGAAEPAVVWLGLTDKAKGARLLRCTDEGARFSDPAPAGCYPAQIAWRAATDPTHRLVACSRGYGRFEILDEESGQVRRIANARVAAYRLDRDANIYSVSNASSVSRLDRDGKPLPFPATANDPLLKGRLPVGDRGNSAWERDFWVDRKGNIYVNRTGVIYHGAQTLEVYDPAGNFKRVALWSVTDGMYGPRVDSRGNVVVMDVVKPPDQPYPKEFSGADPVMYDWFYGSVIKFGPRGGAIWRTGETSSPVDFENWRSYVRVTDLRTTGGCLTGNIVKGARNPAAIILAPGRPGVTVDADKCKTVSLRLKNGTDGTKAVLGFGYELVISSLGQVYKTIDVKPSSDFAEYTFDLSDVKEWKGLLRSIYISPSDTKGEGSFAIDWIKIGTGEGQKAYDFNADESVEARLPADLKKEKVRGFGLGDAVLQGAQWHRQGVSAVSAAAGGPGCHCFGTDFDMDDFGRIFVPDSARFRVGVLDANGNEIASFGAYGNQDFCGPESYVPDPAGKFLRPRQASDPKDLASPFAQPEIAFAWINGVAVTDRHAYVTDLINKRMLKVKLDYAASESCEVK